MTVEKRMNGMPLLLCVALAAISTGAHAQAWTPQRNVEIVVGSAPGGSNDRTARQGSASSPRKNW